VVLGLLASLASGTFAMGQIERGANRIYGVEQDRPTRQKYQNALLLACSAGVLITGALVLFVAGSDFTRALGLSGPVKAAWTVLRWPLSIGLVVAAFALLFREAPRRRQPAASWLAVGSATAVLLWSVFTALLALYLDSSGSFGDTYGPLMGVIGMLAWTFLSSLALYLGLAFAAQLEAVRAGTPGPLSDRTVNPSGDGRAREGIRRPVAR
jgi:YihY family inner membrane protein